MKKIIFVLILALACGGAIHVAEAIDTTGCQPGYLYSPLTGKLCSDEEAFPEGCLLGYKFSYLTGMPCKPAPILKPVPECDVVFPLWTKGTTIAGLQQRLKDEGYYSGNIDGIYGPATSKAAESYNKFRAFCTSSPVITGIKGPQSLGVGQTGTWTVSAYDKSGSELSYRVMWGDEFFRAQAGEVRELGQHDVNTATFTHKYSRAGAYTPVFYVTNETGQSARTSISVKVGSQGDNYPPRITSSPPTYPSLSLFPGETPTFNWSAEDANKDDLSWSIDWGDGEGSAGTCSIKNSMSKKNWSYVASHGWDEEGTYLVKATVTDCKGGADTKSFYVTVGEESTERLSIRNSSPLPDGRIGDNYQVILKVKGYEGSTNSLYWSVTKGSLPPGLSLMASDYGEIINGTPTSPGTYTFVLEASIDSPSTASTVATKEFTLTVHSKKVTTAGDLYIQPSSASIPVGGAIELEAMYQPPSPPCSALAVCTMAMPAPYPVAATWTSSNPKVALISYRDNCPPDVYCFLGLDRLTAVVTGNLQGTAIITAAYTDMKASIKVEVKGIMPPPPETSVDGDEVLGAESFVFTLRLAKGSQGNEVTELQKYLQRRGYYEGVIDGKFGSGTEAALVRFQSVNGIKADGIVGTEVRSLLNK